MEIIDTKYVIESTLDIISTYNSSIQTIDSHFEEKIKLKPSYEQHQDDNKLIHDTCYQYFKDIEFLDIFWNHFYEKYSSRILRSDICLYKLLGYFLFFRLKTIKLAAFKRIVKLQPLLTSSAFLSFVIDKNNLNALLQEWTKLKDQNYIHDVILLPLYNQWDALEKLTNNVNSRASGNNQSFKGTIPLTRPISPNISTTIPHLLPQPEVVSTLIKFEPVPESIYKTSLEEIERKHYEIESIQQRIKTTQKYSESFHFKFHEASNTKRNEEFRREVELKEASTLQFDKAYVNPLPDFNKSDISIKLNVTTILREDHLIKKLQERDEAILKGYEIDLRDANEYIAWQTTMKRLDELEKLKNVEDRREMAKLSSEEAKLAVEKQKQDNRIVAIAMKGQTGEILKQLQLEDEIQQNELKKQARQLTLENEAKIKTVKEQIIKQREENYMILKSELQRSRRRKAALDRFEEDQRRQKVAELKAMIGQNKKEVAKFDPNTAVNVGVLDEMSYTELQELLEKERLKIREIEETRRKDILESMERNNKELQSKIENIMKQREKRAHFATLKRQRRKELFLLQEKKNEELRETSAMKLADELTKKQTIREIERNRLLQEQVKIKEKQVLLGNLEDSLEKLREDELMKAVERKAKVNYDQLTNSIQLYDKTRQLDKKNRIILKQRLLSEKLKDIQERDRTVEREKSEALMKLNNRILTNHRLVEEMREEEIKSRLKLKTLNPYATAISNENRLEATLKLKRSESLRKTGDNIILLDASQLSKRSDLDRVQTANTDCSTSSSDSEDVRKLIELKEHVITNVVLEEVIPPSNEKILKKPTKVIKKQ